MEETSESKRRKSFTFIHTSGAAGELTLRAVDTPRVVPSGAGRGRIPDSGPSNWPIPITGGCAAA